MLRFSSVTWADSVERWTLLNFNPNLACHRADFFVVAPFMPVRCGCERVVQFPVAIIPFDMFPEVVCVVEDSFQSSGQEGCFIN